MGYGSTEGPNVIYATGEDRPREPSGVPVPRFKERRCPAHREPVSRSKRAAVPQGTGAADAAGRVTRGKGKSSRAQERAECLGKVSHGTDFWCFNIGLVV